MRDPTRDTPVPEVGSVLTSRCPRSAEELSLARTSVGDVVYDRILLAIQEGRLLPGERMNDLALAG